MTDVRTCPRCGAVVHGDAPRCDECGYDIVTAPQQAMKACPKCLSEIPAAASRCKHCGHDMARSRRTRTALTIVGLAATVAALAFGLNYLVNRFETRGGSDEEWATYCTALEETSTDWAVAQGVLVEIAMRHRSLDTYELFELAQADMHEVMTKRIDAAPGVLNDEWARIAEMYTIEVTYSGDRDELPELDDAIYELNDAAEDECGFDGDIVDGSTGADAE